MTIPDEAWYYANFAFTFKKLNDDPPLVDLRPGHLTHREVYPPNLEISIQQIGGGAAQLGWAADYWNAVDKTWDELSTTDLPAQGYTAEECLFYSIKTLEGRWIPKWEWELRPIDNPFLSGEEKLQLTLDLYRLSETLDSIFPSPLN